MSWTEKTFRNSLFEYLNNGPQYVPFSSVDLRPKKYNSKRPTQPSTHDEEFQPFSQERDEVGKLRSLKNSTDLAKRKLTTNEDVHPTMHRRIFRQNQPFVASQAAYMPVDHEEDPNQLPEVYKSPRESNNKCRVTNYITELSTHSASTSPKQLFNGIDYYKRKLNKIETGINKGTGSRVLQGKPTSHQALLIGRTYKLSTQPAVGAYDPNYSQLTKNKTSIRWMVRHSHPRILPLDELKSQRNTDSSPLTVHQEENFEVLYSRTINQIKREVDDEVQKNPQQTLHPNKGLTLKMIMTQQEAIDQKNQIQQKLKYIKESIQKVRNMMNMRK